MLAKGQTIGSSEQLEKLLERGAKVNLAELQASKRDPRKLNPAELPDFWRESLVQLGRMLLANVNGNSAGFLRALDDVSQPLLQLIARDPDLAIFQVIRQEGMPEFQYGVQHGVHTGIAAVLAAQQLGSSPEESLRAFRVALTMNLSVLELQGKLAHQLFPLNPKQRRAIQEHPLQSRQMLEERGIQDADWLRAVAEHHESPNGKGYPTGLREPSPLARLISAADTYTAKLSTRASRAPLPADRAVRDFYLARKEEPAAAAILKSFGVYPPGTLLRLASGEIAVSLRRGSTPQTPVAAALMNRNGEPMMNPARRDTAQAANAVQAVLDAKVLRVRLNPEKLMTV